MANKMRIWKVLLFFLSITVILFTLPVIQAVTGSAQGLKATYVTEWSSDGAYGIAADNNYVFVSEYTNDRILRTDTNGGSPTYLTSGFNGPGYLALDSNGYTHISYYDRTNTNLKYAKINCSN